MYKKALIMTLFISILFSNSIIAKDSPSKDKPGSAIFVMAVPKEVKVQTKNIHYADQYVNIEMKLPQIEGLSNKKFQNIVNKYFKIHANTLRSNIMDEAKVYYNQKSNFGQSPVVFELVSNYTVKESMPNYFTIGVFEYTYTGGAHGMSHQKYINIDLVNNKILTLKDLFLKDTEYEQVICEYIKTQVDERTKQGKQFYNIQETLLKMTDDQNFYISKEGNLVIVFNIYEIAPYTSGVVEFTIPHHVMKPYLKVAK
ncbi:MAG: DUF3298 and DUF4163 domain-containing protein [Cellulosilyticaceae bacterium]